MLNRRKIMLPQEIDQAPVPQKLNVRLKKVVLSQKNIHEMKSWNLVWPQGVQWNWELWVDAIGNEYASVKHGKKTIWYLVQRLVPEGNSVGILSLEDIVYPEIDGDGF